MTRCEDCVTCRECGRIAYCLSQPGTLPCPHDEPICEDCLETCPACLAAMEAEMFRSGGEYNPQADPLFNTHAPAYTPPPQYHLAGGRWVRDNPMEGQR